MQEMISKGMKQVDMAEKLQCSPASIVNYKREIPPVQQARGDQLARITDKLHEIESDKSMTSVEKHLALWRWMKLEVDLTGTAAAQKHIHANVTPEHSLEYLKFKKATSGLSENQLEEVYSFASALRRTYAPPVMDASWWPVPMEQKELPPVDEFDPEMEVANESGT